MKLNKKTFLAILTPIFFFSLSNLASADTAYLGFTSSTGSVYLGVSVTYSNQGGTAGGGKFKPGDTLYHSIDVSPNQDIRCANGAGHAQQLYIYGYNLLLGKPDNAYLNYQALTGPEFYIQNNSLVTPRGSVEIPTRIPVSNIINSSPYINPYSSDYLDVYNIPNTNIENAYISNGVFIASFRTGRYDEYGYYQDYNVTAKLIDDDPFLHHFYNRYNVDTSYTPSLVTRTSSKKVNTSSIVYGSNTAAGNNIKIPSNAEAGQYVAQFSLRPSYTNFTPPSNSYSGSWNNAQSGGSNPTPPPSSPSSYQCWDGSTVYNLSQCPPTQTKTCPGGEVVPIGTTCPKVLLPDPGFREIDDSDMLYYIKSFLSTTLQKANAAMDQEQMLINALNGGGGGGGSGSSAPTPPASCGTAWWCFINFYEVNLSTPFEVVTVNTTPGVQVK